MTLDDKFRLSAAELAARDRVYGYLANCPEIMDMINEPTFEKTAEMMSDIRMCSLGKIFWVVAVREIWQQTYPGTISPVGTWESIDRTRMMASSDIRVQCAQTAMAMFDKHDYSVVDVQIECDKYCEHLDEHDDNPVAWGMGQFLPLVVERLCQLYSSDIDKEEKLARAEKFCQEFHNDEEFNPTADDFKEKVARLCESFRKRIDTFNEEGKDGNDG